MPRIYRLLCPLLVLVMMAGIVGVLTADPAAGDAKKQETALEADYEEAVLLFYDRRYLEAVTRFEEIKRAGIPSGSPFLEKVDRYLGEALYQLGRTRGNDYRIRAVDQLKDILKNHRGNPEMNIPVTLMLARTYEGLGFYYEALIYYQQFEKMNRDVKLEQDTGFQIIRLLNMVRRHRQVIERSRSYLKKFPRGPYTALSLFILADSYKHLNLDAQAALWYQEAKKLTPDLTLLPADVLYRYGRHLSEVRAHREAIEVLSLVVNIFSPHAMTSAALTLLGDNHAALKTHTKALKYFSLALTAAKTPEASFDLALRMVDVGINSPGLQVPAVFPGMHNYTNPLAALDNLYWRTNRPAVRRELRIKTAALLTQNGNLREALDIYWELLQGSPPQDPNAHLLTMARQNAIALLDIHLNNDEHLEAVVLYGELEERGLDLGDNWTQLLKLGRSFVALGLFDKARQLYGASLARITDRRVRTETHLALAETELRAGQYEQAESVIRTIAGSGKIADKIQESRALLLLAESQWRRGMNEIAVETYRRATLTGIAFPASQLLNHGDALRDSGMLKAAIGNYQKALKILGDDKESGDLRRQAQMRLADSLFASGDYRASIDVYGRIRAENTVFAEQSWVTYRIGMAFMVLGDYGQAEKFFAALQEQAAQDAYWAGVAEMSLMAVRRRKSLQGG